MFDRIAERYDLLNRIISLGVDRKWRRRTVAALRVDANARVLDLATGTADLAIEVARRTGARVVGVDPSVAMLRIGHQKLGRLGLSTAVDLTPGDAQQLPFDDQSFDAACMAFGIRNVPDRPRALRELWRVLKPGARLGILELSEPHRGVVGAIARFHVHTVVPWVGSILSGAHEYRYLQRSIARFPAPETFNAMLSHAGFEVEPPAPLTFGVVHLYVAVRTA
jgi:demethylmenaquinone methyltransferase/2-methoxy-6-polyprenyl-1,4-benzoquinol methylase